MTQEEIIQRNIEDGWILIGELETGNKNTYPTPDDTWPWFLYVRYNRDLYSYAICKGMADVYNMDVFQFEQRISINTFLAFYVSFDRVYGRSEGGVVGRKGEGQRIRVVGGSWIETNDDFLNGRITLDQLERTFRTDKDKEWMETIKNSRYAPEDPEKLAKFLEKGIIT